MTEQKSSPSSPSSPVISYQMHNDYLTKTPRIGNIIHSNNNRTTNTTNNPQQGTFSPPPFLPGTAGEDWSVSDSYCSTYDAEVETFFSISLTARALHVACANNRPASDVHTLLLNDPDCCTVEDEYGRTPIEICKEQARCCICCNPNRKEVIRMLEQGSEYYHELRHERKQHADLTKKARGTARATLEKRKSEIIGNMAKIECLIDQKKMKAEELQYTFDRLSDQRGLNGRPILRMITGSNREAKKSMVEYDIGMNRIQLRELEREMEYLKEAEAMVDAKIYVLEESSREKIRQSMASSFAVNHQSSTKTTKKAQQQQLELKKHK